MKLKSIRYLLLLISVSVFDTYGQSCAENLELARQYYREGQLHLAYALLDDCLERKELTSEKMIDGYRLLANTSFLLDSTARGENYVRKILNRSLNFQADDTDVFKFRNSLSEIRKIPNIQFGVSFGLNRPTVNVSDTYEAIFDRENAFLIYGLTRGELLTNFKQDIGSSVGIVLIKNIKPKLEVESGVGFQSTKFSYFDQFSNVRKETKIADIQIPVLINYRLPIMLWQNTVALQTGVNLSILNSWEHNNASGDKSTLNTEDVRTSLSQSWVIGAFTNLKIRNVIVRSGIQYWMGLSSRSETLADSENAAFIYNENSFVNYNARLDYFVLSIGILKQRF